MFSTKHKNGAQVWVVILTATMANFGAWADVPATVNIHGQVLDSQSQPLTGNRAYLIRFYDAATGFNQLGGNLTGTVELSSEGLFNLSVTPPAAVLQSPEAWYEISVDSSTPPNGVDGNDQFLNRVKVDSVPFSLQAAEAAYVDASNVGSGTVNNAELDTLHGVTENVQSQLNAKPNVADVYTKSEVDTSQTAQDGTIAAKANAADVYTKSEVDISQSAQDTLITGKFARQGEAHVLVETMNDPLQNAANLLAAYGTAKALTPHGQPLSATNRAVVLVSPGRYDLGTGQLTMDTESVDLVGLSTACGDQYIFGTSNGPGTGVIGQTADDVCIENLLVECTRSSGALADDANDPAAYFPETNRPKTHIRNCEFRADYFCARSMRNAIEYSGHYTDCTGANYSFGQFGTASGTFTNCTGGEWSFARGGVASGTFTNCTGGHYAFGHSGTVSGTFTNCTGGQWSFARGGVASGTFTNCTGSISAFGGFGTASGTFTNCTGGHYAFGGGGDGIASGTFTNCTGSTDAFGGNGGTSLGGKFYACRMTGSAWVSTFRGRMEECFWNVGITCGAEARLYRSNFLGNVDLNSTAAGIAQCAVRGSIQNTGATSFNSGNLADVDVN